MPSRPRPGQAAAAPDTPALSRYLEVIREHSRLVLLCVILVLAATAAYVKFVPRTYVAQAEMLVSPATSTDTTLFNLPVLHASGNPTADVLTAANLVTTPTVADAVRHQLHLRTSRAALLGNVSASPIGQANLIAIQASASSPRRSAKLANAFVYQTVVTRAAALHAAVSAVIPSLQAQVAALPASQRSGPGSIGEQLAALRQLLGSGDPTLTPAATADPPTGPNSPKTKLSLVAGLLAGLLLGLGAAFARHALDPKLRRADQLQEIFDAPVLARIPREPRAKSSEPLLPSAMSMAAREGYRTMRTILASRATSTPQTFLVTGSQPAEGKTTTAIALAISLSQTGARVILIEADVRRPTIARVLKLTPKYGTEDVLRGEVSLVDAIVVMPIENGHLGVLAVREPQVRVVDFLSREVARDMVTAATGLADYIVIDSPPLTAVIDALPLAQVASELLVVSRIGVSKLNRLRTLHKLLVDQDLYPSGVVLVSDSSASSSPYYQTAAPQAGPNGGLGASGVQLEPKSNV